ncbi:MAG: DUF1549 and DUF1553 domain-containing protein [Planctomycetales bacterium]|nr:DUF1549 and DUF1553 domain-containing protein [Planctomycetales bacterium]
MSGLHRSSLVLGFGLAAVVGGLGFAPSAPGGDDKLDPALTPAEIDRLLAEKWTAAGLTPSAQAGDEDFLRRVTLDLTGTIPSLEETEAFIADKNPEKRTALVERLLASAAFADHWAAVLEKVFTGRARAKYMDRPSFRAFFRDRLAEGAGYDRIVREMLTATGDSREVGATNYLVRYEAKPADVAGHTSKSLFGIQIQCAQCHNHPYEKWTTEDFKGFAAFFGQTRPEPVKEPNPRDPKDMRVVSFRIEDGLGDKFDRFKKLDKANPKAASRMMEKAMEKPEIKERLMYAIAQPRYLGTATPVSLDGRTRRQAFADWATSGTNPYFAKAAVNRIWGAFFGRGIVHPVEDMGPRHPASHPDLLDRLARDFVQHGYDLRHTMRLLVSTKTYGLSSAPSENNEGDDKLFSRALVRSLAPEQVFASVFQATELDKREDVRRARGLYLMQAGKALAQFIQTFDDDEMMEEENFEGTIPQALLMLNGKLVTESVAPKEGTNLHTILTGPGDAARKIERIFLATLVRKPTAAELERCRKYVEDDPQAKIEAFKDITWSLINTTEFIVNR